MLLDGLWWDKVHVRPGGGFAHGGGVVRVVLAAAALQAIGGDELGRDHARIKAQGFEFATPVVCARTGLHGNQAAGGQLYAPVDDHIALEGAAHKHEPSRIHGVHLNDVFGQINANRLGSVDLQPDGSVVGACFVSRSAQRLQCLPPFL